MSAWKAPGWHAYWRTIPLSLFAASIIAFVGSSLIYSPWQLGWDRVLLLMLLSIEAFFLPYILLPIALTIAKCMPWAPRHDWSELALVGSNQSAKLITIGSVIVLPGLPVLAAFGSAPPEWAPDLFHIPANLVIAAKTPLLVFTLLTIVLSVPGMPTRE